MKLPLISKKTNPFYPRNGKCPICSAKVSEPNTFLVLNGGALKELGEEFYGMDTDLHGFLDINFHGAHDKGKGKFRERSVSRSIADHAANGQFDIYFCSTVCFRKFINDIIDDMEAELAIEPDDQV